MFACLRYINDDDICDEIEELKYTRDFSTLSDFFNQGEEGKYAQSLWPLSSCQNHNKQFRNLNTDSVFVHILIQ